MYSNSKLFSILLRKVHQDLVAGDYYLKVYGGGTDYNLDFELQGTEDINIDDDNQSNGNKSNEKDADIDISNINLPTPPANLDPETENCYIILQQMEHLLNGIGKEPGIIERFNQMLEDKNQLYEAFLEAKDGDPSVQNRNIQEGKGTWKGHQSKYNGERKELQKLVEEWGNRCDDMDLAYLQGTEVLSAAEEYTSEEKDPPLQPANWEEKEGWQFPDINIPDIDIPWWLIPGVPNPGQQPI